MNSKDIQLVELTRTTTAAINAYCRVMEVHLKAVEQGASPELKGPLGETVRMASEGLKREVEFLRFIRSEGLETVPEKGSQDG